MNPAIDDGRFGGVARLYGAAGFARLQAAQVAVIGLGGVGSWTVEALARSGVGGLTLIDLDDVCVTNINRQVHATDVTVGRPKAEVLRERVRTLAPACQVTVQAEFFTASSAARLLAPGFDVVVDAIDGMSNKARLIAALVSRRLPTVTVGGAGGRRDATQIRTGDLGEAWGDELLRMVRRKLRRDYGFAAGAGQRYGVRCVWSGERPVFPRADGTCAAEPEPGGNLRLDCASGFGTAAHVTGTFGLVAAQEVIGLVLGGAAESAPPGA